VAVAAVEMGITLADKGTKWEMEDIIEHSWELPIPENDQISLVGTTKITP